MPKLAKTKTKEQQKINWLEWSLGVFEKAKKEKKPIILDIYGVWCHWCHRMDEDTYSDPEVISIINERFVPVHVDTDKRPDINERYNQGGWPSTVILDDEGRIITGGTYLPPTQMKALLTQISEAYLRGKIKAGLEPFAQLEKPAEMDISKAIIQDIIDILKSRFDFEYGGFGEPKFPTPDALNLLIQNYKITKDENLWNMAKIMLDGMADGLQDKFEGGFFRYSVTRDWKQPHYEKMLEVNAGLLENYIDAYQISSDQKYEKVAEGIIGFLNSVLSNQERGGFYGSQDADGETAYYGKSLKERQGLPQPFIDKTIYTDLNCQAISAYFKAATVLKESQLKEFGLKTLDWIIKTLMLNNQLYHYWNYKDEKIYLPGLLDDQVFVIRAMIDAFGATQNKKYLEKAVLLADFCLKELQDKEGGFFDKLSGREDIGMLKVRTKPFISNSIAADSFIVLSELTGKESYKEAAEKALKLFIERYKDYSWMAAPYALSVGRFLRLYP